MLAEIGESLGGGSFPGLSHEARAEAAWQDEGIAHRNMNMPHPSFAIKARKHEKARIIEQIMMLALFLALS